MVDSDLNSRPPETFFGSKCRCPSQVRSPLFRLSHGSQVCDILCLRSFIRKSFACSFDFCFLLISKSNSTMSFLCTLIYAQPSPSTICNLSLLHRLTVSCIYRTVRIIQQRNKMIRVSAPIHGGSPIFNKHDSIGYPSARKGGGHQQQNAAKQQWLRKQLYRCNGHPVGGDQNQQNQNIIKTSTSPSQQHQSISINSVLEANLFAGSKSCVTPSPTELPKPPRNWLLLMMASTPRKRSSSSEGTASPHP